MDYFLARPEPKKLSEDELLALFEDSEAKAKAARQNKQTKSCGCCPEKETKNK